MVDKIKACEWGEYTFEIIIRHDALRGGQGTMEGSGRGATSDIESYFTLFVLAASHYPAYTFQVRVKYSRTPLLVSNSRAIFGSSGELRPLSELLPTHKRLPHSTWRLGVRLKAYDIFMVPEDYPPLADCC